MGNKVKKQGSNKKNKTKHNTKGSYKESYTRSLGHFWALRTQRDHSPRVKWKRVESVDMGTAPLCSVLLSLYENLPQNTFKLTQTCLSVCVCVSDGLKKNNNMKPRVGCFSARS